MERRIIRRTFLFIFCSLLLMFGIVGCAEEHKTWQGSQFPDAYSRSDTWLVSLYICGSDLESEHGAASADLAELFETELPDNVRVLILAGGASEWQNETFSADEGNLCLYDKDGLKKLEELEDADMGAAQTLADFLRYGKEHFVADHRVLVFWDHGGGSAIGVCADERTGNILRLNDLRRALASVYTPSKDTPPFELIGFDACLMASYETAASLDGFTRYMVASEEAEPGNGWLYSGWVGALAQNPALGGAGLGQAICDTYMDGCTEAWAEDEATLSLIDMAHLPALRTAYEAYLAESLAEANRAPQTFFTKLSRSAEQAENYGGNTREQGFSNMVDLGGLAHYSRGLAPVSESALKQSIREAVIYKVAGDYRVRGSGISGYYSYDGDEQSFSLYAQQDAAPLAQKCLLYYMIYGTMPKEAESILAGAAQAQHFTLSVPQKKQDLFSLDLLEDKPIDVDADGNAFVQLSAEEMQPLTSVRCHLLYMSEEDDIILLLGSDANVDADWNSGVFKDNFQGTWPMLDGHPVYIELTEENDAYNLYAIPIKLNGVICNLQVAYRFADGRYEILGARRGLEENGMSDRQLIRLKEGDEITTIHYAMTISGTEEDLAPVEIDTFRIGKAPKVEDEAVGDGIYAYAFEFAAPNAQSALSKLAQFTIQKGNIMTSVDLEE